MGIEGETIMNIHNHVSGKIENDKAFVYGVLKRIFSCNELQTQTLAGKSEISETTGMLINNKKLNEAKLDFAYQQYKIRVNAVGNNWEEREARSQRGAFNEYVRMLTDLFHQKRRRMESTHHN